MPIRRHYSGTISPEEVDTEKLNNELWFDPSMSVADMQAELDAAGAGTVVHFETGAYTWDGSLDLYDDTVVYIQSSTVAMASGQIGPMFKNVDSGGNGNDNITIHAEGSEFDGNRGSLTAGDDNYGVQIFIDGALSTDPATCQNVFVYGGEWHDFRSIGLYATQVEAGAFEGFEAHHNGEPGDTASGGDGAYAGACKDFHIEGRAHDNERHGASIAGTGTDRSVNCSMQVDGEDNGNDNINVEACENVQIQQSTSRNGGLDGVHVKGTGTINVNDTGSSDGPLFSAEDYTGTTAYLTGETGGESMTVNVTSVNSNSNGVNLRGTGQMTIRPTVTNASGIGIFNAGNVPDLTIEDPHVESTDRYSIFLGNATDITAEVSGGRVDDWDRGSNGEGAIVSGNSLGDRCTISGVSVGVPANTSAGGVLKLAAGDYHSVVGCATGGQAISINGSNSTTAGNN